MQVPSPFIPSASSELPGDGLNTPSSAFRMQDQLVRARLGPYAGLFFSLRAKHPPAAAHSLRVAVLCSKWAIFHNLPEQARDILEIAGLVHDVGKIGVSDSVLQKPESLNVAEQHAMEMAIGTGLEILTGVGASAMLLETIQQARYAQDSGFDQNPLARMLKIADAFDSMTTMQVFRAAFSRERAVDELFANAGTQFDPELVKNFASLVSQPRNELEEQVTQHWTSLLHSNAIPHFEGLSASSNRESTSVNLVNALFHNRLVESLADAAIYLDRQGKILYWNRAAEQISGRAAESVQFCLWTPKLLGLHDLNGIPIANEACPLQQALQSNAKHEVDLIAVHPNGKKNAVALTAIPVFADKGVFIGFILQIRDDSRQTDLEQRVRKLHQAATQDPLTKVANRAELNRRLEEFIADHPTHGTVGSVIMCDIDYFKRINDTYSHQAGDEALITFAKTLRDASRQDDLVARYGGEEFVILCDSCDINAAHAQAEKIRKVVESTPVPALNGHMMTASFGVTQLQSGDDSETFVARADRALMSAKETGRNRVVQLGGASIAGSATHTPDKDSSANPMAVHRNSWLGWFTGQTKPICQREYLSAVPIEIAVQKLQGFISDHKAEILSTTPDHISIRIKGVESARRRSEHPVSMIMNMDIHQVQFCLQGRSMVYQNRTKFVVGLFPVKSRDRRQAALQGQAHQILLSFQAYIVGQEIDDQLRLKIIEPRQ